MSVLTSRTSRLRKDGSTAAGALASAGRAETLSGWTRLAYCENVRSYFLSIEGLNGCSRTFSRGHGDEPITTRAAIGAINRDIDLGDIAVGGKQFHKLVVGGGRSEIINA